MCTFVPKGNESFAELLRCTFVVEVQDLPWFKQQLIRRNACSLEIAWGNYVAHFYAVPPQVMEGYLHYRRKYLHNYALQRALLEEHQPNDYPLFIG